MILGIVGVVVVLVVGVVVVLHRPTVSPNNPTVPVPHSYNLTFDPAGLATGTTWNVTVNGTVRSASDAPILFSEINGSYAYAIGPVPGYLPSANSGTVTVHGAAVTVNVSFTRRPPATYSVTFTAVNATTGLLWNVTLGAQTLNTTTDSISFTEANGTYPYRAATVLPETVVNGQGAVVVRGEAVNVYLQFASAKDVYLLFVEEGGLPKSTDWSYTVDGTTYSSVTDQVVVSVHDGNHSLVAGSVHGYTPSPANQTLLIDGSNSTVLVYYYNATNRVPLGSALAVGNPVFGTCSASQVGAHVCETSGDGIFTLTVEQSVVRLGNALFSVHTASGSLFKPNATGSFAIQNISGVGIAFSSFSGSAGAAMTTLWGYYAPGDNASTPLTSTMTFVFDTGEPAVDWVPGQGNYVVASGVGMYDGTIEAQALP